MAEFKAHFKSVQPDLGGSLPGRLIFGIPGKDGGYYLVAAEQVDASTIRFTFTPSKEDMPTVAPMEIKLPGVSAEQIAKAVEEYFAENPPTGGTVTDEQIAEAVDKYLETNPPKVTESDPTVPDWAKEKTKPSYSKSEVGLGNVENVKQYSPSNPPPYPVASVNGQTGKVKLGAGDVGARPSNWIPTAAEVGALPDTYVPPNQTAAQVGADPIGTAAATVRTHNTSPDSHGDLRLELKAINDRLTAFFDSDNQTLDELSEIVAYITSNKALIDSITTSKVSVADIINNLTTNVANKPLSAAQGVALKGLIDAVSTSLANYQPKGDYALRSELPTVPTNVSAFTNDAGYLTEHQDISGKVDKAGLTLGRHADGLLYVFVDGQPVGNGVDLPAGGIDGYITPDKQIVFNNLPDGEYTLAYINDDGSIVPIGAMEKDTNVYYTVTNTLTNCVSSNSDTQAIGGKSYSATISANDGYELSSVMVTMGGTDISSTAVSGGKITIANVTGDIVITATATEIQTGPSYTNLLPLAVDASGNDFVGTHEKGGDGYEYGYKLSTSSGNPSATEGVYISGFIPLTDINAIVRIKNITLSGAASINNIVVYDANKAKVYGAPGTAGAFNTKVTETEGVYSFEVKNWTSGDIAFFRFSCAGISADTIVTVDEEIV